MGKGKLEEEKITAISHTIRPVCVQLGARVTLTCQVTVDSVTILGTLDPALMEVIHSFSMCSSNVVHQQPDWSSSTDCCLALFITNSKYVFGGFEIATKYIGKGGPGGGHLFRFAIGFFGEEVIEEPAGVVGTPVCSGDMPASPLA